MWGFKPNMCSQNWAVLRKNTQVQTLSLCLPVTVNFSFIYISPARFAAAVVAFIYENESWFNI